MEFVYVARHVSGGSKVKIGRTRNVDSRMKDLACTALVALQVRDSRELEAHLHSRFRDLRAEGEWFRFEGPLERWVDLWRDEVSASEMRSRVVSYAVALRQRVLIEGADCEIDADGRMRPDELADLLVATGAYVAACEREGWPVAESVLGLA